MDDNNCKHTGQDRARGRHLTAANTLSAFGLFNKRGWVGGGGGGGGGGGVLSALILSSIGGTVKYWNSPILQLF